MNSTAQEPPKGATIAVVADVYDAVSAAFKDRDLDASQKNADFKMIFKRGWMRIQALAKHDPTALRLWAFFAEYASANGSLMICQTDIATELGITSRTVRRALKVLEDNGAVFTIREAGGNIYCLDPNEVWGMMADSKRFAPFKTHAIFSKKAQGVITKRLTVAKVLNATAHLSE